MKKELRGFKMGECVKVKNGILDPDNDEYCIANWQGRIIEEFVGDDDTPIYLIKWDSITLKQIPASFIEESIREDLEWGEMYLGINDIEHASGRDTEGNVDDAVREINAKYPARMFTTPSVLRNEPLRNELDEQEKGIGSILVGVNMENELEVEEKWEEYLNEHLDFPFDAIINNTDEDAGAFDIGDMVSVKRIDGIFDIYGIIVEVRKGRRKYHFPLCELEVSEKNSANYTIIDDYNFWFSNR
ncbi:hypothetical protein Amet_3362 [Alkaliphilus metalliredigens QYMF]|uniref:Uncharacterized protein n=1 Tax=Alkaliphilus metalliredigens (strain QYMF) TaxID=293826 RepID=A6TTH2_ALKMQ|nr:calcium-binding protein [Alkaliphilus metalliredigens]ABR49490.1 hypothetical protein Amet_3362 [Alkaliphilus metalliredigens QYMF]